MTSSHGGGDEADDVPLFDPPLYLQRMARVADLLATHGARDVIDLGCGEGRLMQFLRTNETYTRIRGVDIDDACVRKATVALQPLLMDHLQPRLHPLVVELYHGSVASIDESFVGTDALASVEVVEHLDPPVLEQFRHTVFGHYHPRVVVLTTPNADFNVFFPALQHEGRFRHPDHRFEWTRAEFQTWCTTIAHEFKYSVSFDGIGYHPSGDSLHGHCSQLALFIRQDDAFVATANTMSHTLPGHAPPGPPWPIGSRTPYQLAATVRYPHITDHPGWARAAIWAALRTHGIADEQPAMGLREILAGNSKLAIMCDHDETILTRWLQQQQDDRMPLECVCEADGGWTVRAGILPDITDADDSPVSENHDANGTFTGATALSDPLINGVEPTEWW